MLILSIPVKIPSSIFETGLDENILQSVNRMSNTIRQYSKHIAPFQIIVFSRFLTTPAGLSMVLFIVWPRIFCCVLFIEILIICEKMFLVLFEKNNPRFGCIMYNHLKCKLYLSRT